MHVNAEADGIPRLEQERNRHLTPFGKFLRAHHLDELPQLWNVLKGDMSFVGPRPERQYFIDQINRETEDYHYVYLMRPGITSYATIYNGYTDTMDKMLKRLEYDLDYLDNRSLMLDLKIIVKTVLSIVSGKKF
jgi:lipopolysaccharide/colanic/teichoic acid biosynthesis glycosyltransferase